MTSTPLPDTWSRRDLPVLRTAVAAVDAKPGVGITLGATAAITGQIPGAGS